MNVTSLRSLFVFCVTSLTIFSCADATLEIYDGAPSAGEIDNATSTVVVETSRQTDWQLEEDVEHACVSSDRTPQLIEDVINSGTGFGLTARLPDDSEEHAGLDATHLDLEYDQLVLGPELARELVPTPLAFRTYFGLAWLAADYDNDCAINSLEISQGTNMNDPDSDDDGWFDGPCNERISLRLTRIKAYDEQEDIGVDETYLIVDNVRHPSGDLDDYWDFNDGTSRSYDRVLAQRTRGTWTNGLKALDIEGWEDDFELANTWAPDDLLFEIDLDLGSYYDGQTFTRRRTEDDWDYKLTFRVDIEMFADPNPTADGDDDEDGISESAEANVGRSFGGITDPSRPDILVEVDWMPNHYLGTRAKRMVTTQLHRHGYFLYLHRNKKIELDDCLTRTEAIALYNDQFSYSGYDAFRYAVMSEQVWIDASGVAIGDTFFVDDSTWWINSMTLPQAGTFIHELGHTISLTSDDFNQIDTVGSIWYDSSMNYLYQATMVDYSDNGSGGNTNDHNDWADVDLPDGLDWSFGTSTQVNDGICD